jgi:hypothetical protein
MVSVLRVAAMVSVLREVVMVSVPSRVAMANLMELLLIRRLHVSVLPTMIPMPSTP